jgi:xanthine dehydrogenase accessory factor
MDNLFAKASELQDSYTSFAVATIVFSIGSTPRSKAKMIITEYGETFGTIGGGLAESMVIKEAAERIKTGKSGIISYRLDQQASKKSIDMLCGGDLDIFIEVVGTPRDLMLIGGGHVNLELARLAHKVGFAITVAETREDFAASQRFPMAKRLVCDSSIEKAVTQLPIKDTTAVLIATHDHDSLALKHLINSPAAYIGMLGSRKKVSHLKEQLISEGTSPSLLKRLHAPAGLDIGAETPEQIAVSIVAEIMSVVQRRSGLSLSQRAENLVVVRGAGDIATGVIIRLARSGFRVLALEMPKPTVIRTTVSFAQAIYDGTCVVEGITAAATDSFFQAKTLMDEGNIPVMADPEGLMVPKFKPNILVDAIIAKKNLGTSIDDAPLVIGLGPGFSAGSDVDMVIETNRGHDLGRVITVGSAAENTGVPGTIEGEDWQRVLRAPEQGVFTTEHKIGDLVQADEVIGTCADKKVLATIPGVIRGLLSDGLYVTKGFKIGDIDPRGDASYCYRVSDKARAIAGGVLEAILMHTNKGAR